MGTEVSLSMLLSGKQDRFALDGPCACCGEESAAVWDFHHSYTIRKWGRNSKGQLALVDQKDTQDKSVKGVVDIQLPYCVTHLRRTKRLNFLRDAKQTILILVGVAAVLAFIIGVAAPWSTTARDTQTQGVPPMCSPHHRRILDPRRRDADRQRDQSDTLSATPHLRTSRSAVKTAAAVGSESRSWNRARTAKARGSGTSSSWTSWMSGLRRGL